MMDNQETRAAILENARRLLTDAEILFKAGRYPTALAIAILSVEESGKAYLDVCLRHNLLGDETRSATYHATKQKVLGSFYHADIADQIMRAWATKMAGAKFEEGRTFRDWAKSKGFPFPDDDYVGCFGFLGWALTEPELRETAQEIRQIVLDLIIATITRHPHGKLSERAARGEIDALKKRALYLDADAAGRIKSHPAEIGREMAERWIMHAREFAERAESVFRDLREEPSSPPA
jgi:AbiV family abortive infection protein